MGDTDAASIGTPKRERVYLRTLAPISPLLSVCMVAFFAEHIFCCESSLFCVVNEPPIVQ